MKATPTITNLTLAELRRILVATERAAGIESASAKAIRSEIVRRESRRAKEANNAS